MPSSKCRSKLAPTHDGILIFYKRHFTRCHSLRIHHTKQKWLWTVQVVSVTCFKEEKKKKFLVQILEYLTNSTFLEQLSIIAILSYRLNLLNVVLLYLLTVPWISREASKNIVSTFHNCNRRAFVITHVVKSKGREAISRCSEQKMPFIVLRQPTNKLVLVLFVCHNHWFFKIFRCFRLQLLKNSLDLVELSFICKFF